MAAVRVSVPAPDLFNLPEPERTPESVMLRAVVPSTESRVLMVVPVVELVSAMGAELLQSAHAPMVVAPKLMAVVPLVTV